MKKLLPLILLISAILIFTGCKKLKPQGTSFASVNIKNDDAKGKIYTLIMKFEKATTDSNNKAYIRVYDSDKKLGQFYYNSSLASKVNKLQAEKKYIFQFEVTSIFINADPVDGNLIAIADIPE